MAPELFKKGVACATCDCWSIGAMIFFLLTGCPPFAGDTDNEIRANIEARNMVENPIWNNLSSDVKDIIDNLLCLDPAKRFTIDQVLSHPWIVNGDSIEERENNHDDNDAFENMK